MNGDQLQNEVLLLAHHFDDMEAALRKGDIQYALEGLKDARESVMRLNGFLQPKMQSEIDRIAESIG